ncbi:MAG TPA: S41 family peptidase, partial [Gemmatimonadaceae bacterium]|nr:S41 family peptidase [Gemmatimonadaceae bacterium]
MRPSPRPRRRRALLLLACIVAACGDSTPSAPNPADRAALFDAYWTAFDRTYPYFPVKGVDWDAQRATYRDRAAATTSTAALVDVLVEMTAPLKDVHTGFVRPNGSGVGTYAPVAEVNWSRDQWLRWVQGNGYVQVKANLGYATLAGGVGYVVIGTWMTGAIAAADVDPLLDRYAQAPGLIIDVRVNPGGNDLIARDVAGRFLT